VDNDCAAGRTGDPGNKPRFLPGQDQPASSVGGIVSRTRSCCFGGIADPMLSTFEVSRAQSEVSRTARVPPPYPILPKIGNGLTN
jgi:hypothetical protein